MLEHKGDLCDTHVVQVNPRDTTKECAKCGGRQTNRYGYGNTVARRVGLRRAGMRMHRTMFFLTVFNSYSNR